MNLYGSSWTNISSKKSFLIVSKLYYKKLKQNTDLKKYIKKMQQKRYNNQISFEKKSIMCQIINKEIIGFIYFVNSGSGNSWNNWRAGLQC